MLQERSSQRRILPAMYTRYASVDLLVRTACRWYRRAFRFIARLHAGTRTQYLYGLRK